MTLSNIFDERSIILNLEGRTKDSVFTELADAITAVHPGLDKNDILSALHERENKMTTGIIPGAAIPHGYCQGVNTIVGAIGLSAAGIDYGALDREPVHVVFMLIMGETSPENHLRALNQVFALAKSEAFALVRSAQSVREIRHILSRFH